MKQLAELGVAIPDEFRAEMAMAGDWQVVAETVLPAYGQEENEDVKPGALAVGVRKRKQPGGEEEEETFVRKGWGTAVRAYPGASGDDADLDELLTVGTFGVIKKEEEAGNEGIKNEEVAAGVVKREDGEDVASRLALIPDVLSGVSVKQEDSAAVPEGIVFKKRKAKKQK